MRKAFVFVVLALASVSVLVAEEQTPGVSPGAGVRYATDAYPGFENEKDSIKPERKSPRWFAFIFGPNRDDATSQFAYCQDLLANRDYSKAAKQLDALVREWPTAVEAPKAQQLLAETLWEPLHDYEEAFAAYRYLLDFYSLQCDYDEIAGRLYQLAGVLREEGKEVMFVRFENLTDVRRAYEACVLRAPGAKWAPKAMLTIARLRVAEQFYLEAIKVYESLRNHYSGTEEALEALAREAEVRVRCLHEWSYNRARCQDSINFFKLALKNCRESDREKISGYLDDALAQLETEDYRGAKFYDSPTRTVRSAISAYERFLMDYPNGVYSDAVRQRLSTLKGE